MEGLLRQQMRRGSAVLSTGMAAAGDPEGQLEAGSRELDPAGGRRMVRGVSDGGGS